MHILAVGCLFLIILVNLARLPEIIPFLAPFHVGKLCLLAGVTVALAANPGGIRNFFTATPVGRLLAVIYALAFLGVPFSVWQGGAFTAYLALSKAMIIITVIFCLAERGREQALRVCAIASVMILAVLMVADKSAGRLHVSATHDPNDIALLFAVFLPVIVTEGIFGGALVRILAWPAAVCSVIGIALAGSRGGLLALAAVGGHAILASKKYRWAMLPLLVAGGILVGLSADENLWARFSELRSESDYNFTAEEGRIAMWKHGLALMAQNPLMGVGIGQFAPGVGMTLGGRYKAAHNSFIQIGAELGIPGLIAFCALLVAVARIGKSGASSPLLSIADQARHKALLVGLTGYCVGGFFLSQAYGSILHTFLALAAVMHLRLVRVAAAAQTWENKTPATSGEETTVPMAETTLLRQADAARRSREDRLSQGDAYTRRRRVNPEDA